MKISTAAYAALIVSFARRISLKIIPRETSGDILFVIPYPKTPVLLARVKTPVNPAALAQLTDLLKTAVLGLAITRHYYGDTSYMQDDFTALLNFSSKEAKQVLGPVFHSALSRSVGRVAEIPGIVKFEVA